ncbi:helix-turn-helix domain-containing protein [Flavobacterium sp.]|uniref:helix-turn-helix domain-containing protein n=1 Tax=Flavobacterium sp. TaxID=239 RepID=UPI0037BF6182
MEIKFFKPKSEILQKYIEGYYFLTKKETEPTVEYLTFPNNYSIISVYQDTEIVFTENQALVKEKIGNPFESDLICHYKKPIKIICEGNLNEVTFYFKPLGLNAFITKSLCYYTNNFFSKFFPFEDYEKTMLHILNENDFEKRCEMIENYWLSKLNGFSHPFLNELIVDLKNDYSMAELAKKYNTSRQNINKHFESNLCKTPSDFKKTQRFREALKSQMNNKNKNNLTSLSYDMLFYDQSHLIKDFKSLTGLTPKNFFKNISSQEDGEVNWLFV